MQNSFSLRSRRMPGGLVLGKSDYNYHLVIVVCIICYSLSFHAQSYKLMQLTAREFYIVLYVIGHVYCSLSFLFLIISLQARDILFINAGCILLVCVLQFFNDMLITSLALQFALAALIIIEATVCKYHELHYSMDHLLV